MACMALALLVLVAPARPRRNAAGADAIAAPFVAAGAVVEGAVGGIGRYSDDAHHGSQKLRQLRRGLACAIQCGFSACESVRLSPVSYVSGDYGRY